MQKSKLTKFIEKYNLGGSVNSVKVVSKDNTLSTTFVTEDKSLMGNVKLSNYSFEDCKLGVYQTDQLQKLLGVLNDDVNLNLTKVDDKAISLKIKDDLISVDYQLSDLSVIGTPPTLQRLPEFQTKIKINKHFIDTFIRGKSALETNSFTIVNNNGNLNIVIGYSTINTNRVNIPVETTENGLTDNISFNANLFRDVLLANKECTSAVLEVSNEGLARINFKIDDYDSTYYVVATQGVD